jgi:hypothetical protein
MESKQFVSTNSSSVITTLGHTHGYMLVHFSVAFWQYVKDSGHQGFVRYNLFLVVRPCSRLYTLSEHHKSVSTVAFPWHKGFQYDSQVL